MWWMATVALAADVDLAPSFSKGQAFTVEQRIGKRVPDPNGDGQLASEQVITWEIEVLEGGRLGTDTVALKATCARVQHGETASGEARSSFDSKAEAAGTDDEKIMAVGVGHTWETWLSADGTTHVKQDRATVEANAKEIGMPAQLQDLLLSGWTDEALGATMRDLVWEGPMDARAPGATWSDEHPGGAALTGAQGPVSRTWTFDGVDDGIATLRASFDVPMSHAITGGTCALTLRLRPGGAPVERKTECAVDNAMLKAQQDVWLSYSWSPR